MDTPRFAAIAVEQQDGSVLLVPRGQYHGLICIKLTGPELALGDVLQAILPYARVVMPKGLIKVTEFDHDWDNSPARLTIYLTRGARIYNHSAYAGVCVANPAMIANPDITVARLITTRSCVETAA